MVNVTLSTKVFELLVPVLLQELVVHLPLDLGFVQHLCSLLVELRLLLAADDRVAVEGHHWDRWHADHLVVPDQVFGFLVL